MSVDLPNVAGNQKGAFIYIAIKNFKIKFSRYFWSEILEKLKNVYNLV